MTKYFYLNKLNLFDNDFSPMECKFPCNQITWTSSDPRLQSSAHNGTRITLDRPPLSGKIQETEVYCARPGYGYRYNNYSDIGGGQINYYVDKSLARPFISELFRGKSLIAKNNYKDPMGSCKPHYRRKQIQDCSNCLSWITDSENHRQDLLSKQLWRRNQSNWATNEFFP